VCTGGKCATPSCTDGVKDGAETDVDCGGGTCPKCADAKACLVGTDCVDAVCGADKTCSAPSCTDGLKNGAETDVDCGGGTCPKCADTKACLAGTDCVDAVCDAVAMTCSAPSCTDKVKNGAETDVDCGGGTCPKCADTKACLAGTDCVDAVCDAVAKTCTAPSCTDGIKNGTESDVDCGGTCTGCALGKTCTTAADCNKADCTGAVGAKVCTTVTTCKAMLAANPAAASGIYTIDPDGPAGNPPFQAYCDMTSGGGGWTLALKADGTQMTFNYDAALWTNNALLNPDKPDFDSNEAKLQTWNSVPFDTIRLAMRDPNDFTTRYLNVPAPGSTSLFALFSPDATIATTLGRAAWEGLLNTASLQQNCNVEGLNVNPVPGNYARVRIGYLANQEPNCGSPDSWLGIGGTYPIGDCSSPSNPSVGNETPPNLGCGPYDNGVHLTAAFGWVFVR
jgi:hypothetical protein